MGESRSNSGPVAEVLLALDRDGDEPMHRQIATAIRDGIRAGRLLQGSALPPTRTLAASLDLSRGVIVEAYQQLKAEGYLTSKSGGYTEVATDQAAAPPPPPDRAASSEPLISFRYGRADPAHFPRAAWLRSVKRALTESPTERFGYPAGEGIPELRHALAEYLNRVRGTNADPRNVVICNGFAQGITLVIQVLAANGARRIVVEDPSSACDLVPAARVYGVELVPVPAGPEGLRTELLGSARADAVIVTPSHQWPAGAVLSPGHRAELLRWARTTGGVIVEDDYDAELRYDRAPVGALHGLAPEHVIYAGTASKTLAPGLRLGWLILPSHLVSPVAAAKVAADRGSPVIDQLTFADFLTRGQFDRHLRRIRPMYRRRRDALIAGLASSLPGLRPEGISAGFHLITRLPPGLDEDVVIAAAARAGVGVFGVAPYRLTPGPGALLFGYAGLDEHSITEAVTLLGRTVGPLL